MQIINIIVVILAAIAALGFIFIIKQFQVPAKIKKAEDYFNIGEYNRASEIVKGILEKRKEYVPAKYLRSKILMNQNQYLLAISELNNILQIPDYTKHVEELKIHYHLAELYNLTKQWQKEISSYKIILSYNPDDVTANHRVGLAFYKQKNYHDTRETLLKALAVNPALTDSYLPVGVSCFQMADYENSEQYLLKCLDRKDTGAEAAFFLGQIYQGKMDYEAAIKMYEKSQKDRQFFRKSLYKVGEIHHKNEDYTEAINVLEKGLNSLKTREEESINYRYLLAECYELDNQVTEALHHWEKIEQEYPNYKNTQMKIAEYKEILSDENMKTLMISSMDDLQPILTELLAQMNFNIVSKTILSKNTVFFRAFNTKRINEPPVLIVFTRAVREISENQIKNFVKKVTEEKCKRGIFLTTSRFSVKAKSTPGSRVIEMHDKEFLSLMLGKITGKPAKK